MYRPTVSVIVPTYNSSPLLLYTLHSLNRQTYPNSNYEIIVVNDGSTDNTAQLLKSLKFPNLKIIENPQNKGAAAARNRGLKAVEGELTIFCDSDFILPSTWISSHVLGHQFDRALALSGMGHWHYILSYDFKERWNPLLQNELKNPSQGSLLEKHSKTSANDYIIGLENIYNEVFKPFVFVPKYLIKWTTMYEEIIEYFGPSLKRFHYPWLSFCTGNLSILTDNIKALGAFDERFIRHEDWELGYRFHCDGGKFSFSLNSEAYQQISPLNLQKISKEQLSYQMFCNKHPSFEVYLLSLFIINNTSFKTLSSVITQHYAIKNIYPDNLITNLFQKMIFLYASGRKPPLKRKILYINQTTIDSLLKDLDSTGNYTEWLNCFCFLYYGGRNKS